MAQRDSSNQIFMRSIGVIRSPYRDTVPSSGDAYRTVYDPRDFSVVLDDEYAGGLTGLSSFTYVFVLSYLHRRTAPVSLQVISPWSEGHPVGLFASRTPNRPNPIGLHVARLLEVQDTTLYISPIDVLDETPLLDIKPYMRELDSRVDANYGWLETFGSVDHLLMHLKGIEHDPDAHKP